MTDDDRPIVDYASAVDLHNGWAAVVAVADDGSRSLWLLWGDPDPKDTAGCACSEHAPHDQVGPLPADWEQRITNAYSASAARCGAPTTSTGEPCRAWVTAPGDRCRHHRTARRRTDA